MSESETVLIIDDEEDACVLWTAFLASLNLKVFTAANIRDGLRSVEQFRPDVVFLDNNLPDGLGWEYVDHIRSILPDCKINLISAYHYDASPWLGKNVRVFEKPLSLSMIRAALV